MEVRLSPDAVSSQSAKTRRQQARSAGLHPDYWYAVEYSSALKRGTVLETVFWGRSIALFRGEDNLVCALDNRCLHRQIKLSLGEVRGCSVVCPYHGWTYDGSGKVISVPHELFSRGLPKASLASFPVRERYGLIWLFPGDPTLAHGAPMPEIPELEGPGAWACVPLDFTWRTHHSMVIENVSDFTHAHLHRKYRPFTDAKLTYAKTEGRRVCLGYEVLVGDGRFSRYFVDRKKVNVNAMELCFEYPYQWSNTGDRIKHWCFLQPMAPDRTRVFFLFYFDALRIPFTRIAMPRWLMKPLLRGANAMTIRPILLQDGEMVEAEWAAYSANPDATAVEFNPAVLEFQNMIVSEWRRYLEGAN